ASCSTRQRCASSRWRRPTPPSRKTSPATPISCTSPAPGLSRGPTSSSASEPGAVSDRYAVIGNPVSHSKSPLIHAAFARQTGQDIRYDRLLAPLDRFEHAVREFFHDGGHGLNVTVPFKREAWDLVDRCEGGALLAEAVNTIKREGAELVGYNTDGTG